MVDLVAFLRARLDDDQRIAEAATAGPWKVDDVEFAESIDAADGVSPVAGARWGGEAGVFESTEDAIHIARHDPSRVLAEVAAKRAILDLHLPVTVEQSDGTEVNLDPPYPCEICWDSSTGDTSEWPCPTLRLLVLPFRDHPDFDPAWTEETR